MVALYAVGGVVLLAVLLLAVPVDVAFALGEPGDRKAHVKVGWLFGLIGKDISPRRTQPVPVRRGVRLGRLRRKARRSDAGLFLAVVRTRGIAGALVTAARRMRRGFRIRQLDAELRLGFEDPADTGIACAVAWAALAPFRLPAPVNFRLDPAFDGPTFEANLNGDVRVLPLLVAVGGLRFALSPAGLRMIRLLVTRWRKKPSSAASSSPSAK